MKICKYAFDKEDEYCATCDGVQMEVDGNLIPCDQCAGYEEGTEEATNREEAVETVTNDECIEEENTVEEPEHVEIEEEPKKEKPSKKQTTSKTSKKKKEVVETIKDKKVNVEGANVTSIRFTSGATVKKGDNYFKFVAEKELDLSSYDGKIEDVEEQLWADLNSQIDKQVEDLQ
nr:MAG TPA: Molybdenum Cofactor Synthesis C [Caudoviricetes sp.]